jgi:hypothetical protein
VAVAAASINVSRAVVILGVSRSGTTLLKEMVGRHSRLAIPTESYFIPQLWDRHGAWPVRDAFLADVSRLARVREWGVCVAEVRNRLPGQPSFAEAIDAIYAAYAAAQGKERYGDKTPAYMQSLATVARAFPHAQYLHVVRDGRDAGLSFLAMKRRPRFNLARPRALFSFAAQWRLEIEAARRFGATRPYLELRYEDLVSEPEAKLREICAFLGLPFEHAMLDYHRGLSPERLLDHPKLAEPPSPGRSCWRAQLKPREVEQFEGVAGDVLAALGYERAFLRPSRRALARGAAARADFATRLRCWRTATVIARKSPAWRARQVYIRRTASAA